MAPAAGLSLQTIDEVDEVQKATARTGPDAASSNGDGEMSFAGAGPVDQDSIAMLGDEAAASEIIDKRLVDGSALEYSVVEILGQRQFSNRELVLDRARLLLVDLGIEQIADDPLGLVLTRLIRAIVSTISNLHHLLHNKAGSAADQLVGGSFFGRRYPGLVNIASRMTIQRTD